MVCVLIVGQIIHGTVHLLIAVVANLKSPLVEESTQLGLVSLALFIGALMLTYHVLTSVGHVVHFWACWSVGPFSLLIFKDTFFKLDTAAA